MERSKRRMKGALHLFEVFILSLIVFFVLLGTTHYIPTSFPSLHLTLTPYLQQMVSVYNYSGIQSVIEGKGGKRYYISYIYKNVVTENESIEIICKGEIKKVYLIMEDGSIEKICEQGKEINTLMVDEFTSNRIVVFSTGVSAEALSFELKRSPYTFYLVYHCDPYNSTDYSSFSSTTLFGVINDTVAYNLVVMS